MKYILIVNPWIYDFAAFDFWMKPLGLLYIAAMLKENGIDVQLIDFLNRNHPSMPPRVRKSIYGKGHYLRIVVETPPPLKKLNINRRFARYGIPKETLQKELPAEAPSLILITSTMTYWYMGTKESIKFLREAYPNTPIIVGGIYPTLCFEHARHSVGADYVIKGHNPHALQEIIQKHTGLQIELKQYKEFKEWPAPAIELLPNPTYAVLTTTLGCPYRCPYCASPILHSRFETKSAKKIVREIEKMTHLGIRDVAFYDDALLYNSNYMKEILKGILSLHANLRFHTPNAIHARFIDKEIATLLKSAGFVSIYLGLETADFNRQKALGGKVFSGEFSTAVKHLKAAGITDISAYILVGLPGQTVDEVKRTIDFCHHQGVKPYLSEFSPIPGTPMWKPTIDIYGLKEPIDPLLHNNTLMPIFSPVFTQEVYKELKELQKQAAKEIKQIK